MIAFISGLTSLGYQVAWTRLLTSGTGGLTYVFTVILALFLIGIALGATTFNALRPRIKDPVRVLAISQIIVAVLSVAGLILVVSQPRSLDGSQPLLSMGVLMGAADPHGPPGHGRDGICVSDRFRAAPRGSRHGAGPSPACCSASIRPEPSSAAS